MAGLVRRGSVALARYLAVYEVSCCLFHASGDLKSMGNIVITSLCYTTMVKNSGKLVDSININASNRVGLCL